MSEKVYQFEDFQIDEQKTMNADSSVLHDFLTCDFNSSETILNDLFSEYDVNINDLQRFDTATNQVNYAQLPTDLSSSNSTVLHSTTTDNEIRSLQSVTNEALSPVTLQFLMEQYHTQQTDTSLTSMSSNYIPTNHPEQSITTNMSNSQSDRIIVPRKQTTDSSHSSLSVPVQLSQSIQAPEPIPVTFDQFKALICATSESSKTDTHTISTLLKNSTFIGHNIPLKLVYQTSQIRSLQSSDDQNSSTNNTNNDQQTITDGNSTRTRRKPSHTVIEKRYRSSINEKIDELKEIVATSDGKIQKSGILRQTVGYIRQLQSTNQRLEEENSTLKSILKHFNLTNTNVISTDDNGQSLDTIQDPTPPPSTFDDDTSDEAESSTSKRQKRTNSKRGMVNGSRLVLCGFMLCILIINPFNYLLDRIHSSSNSTVTEIQSIISSRTLQATTDTEHFHSLMFFSISWKQLVAWMLNIAICLVCLVKLFVHGEPIVHESEMDEYYACKKKADQFMNKNDLYKARIYYQKCCEKLYIFSDHTNVYHIYSITWQIIRLCLNLIFVGRWLIYWSGWTKSIDTRTYNRELNDCLLQLWKIEYYESSSLLNLLNLFVSTINTSINSGKKLDRIKRNEICLLSALTFKKFDGLCSLFIPYLLKFLQPINTNDIWLLDNIRLNRFLMEKNINLFKETTFLESIRIQYLKYLLYESILNQLFFHDEQQPIMTNNELSEFSWWQYSLQVVHCISSDKQNINHVIATDFFRQGEISAQTIYHRARAEQLVSERYIMIIETIHHILIVLTEDDDQTNSTRIILLEQLGVLSRSLTSMIDIDYKTSDEDNLETAIKTLLLDGILSLRLRLLTSSMTNNNQRIPYLDDFRRELDHYKQLHQIMKLPKQRFYLFESIFRTSSGLNPLITQTLLERAIKQPYFNFQTKEELSLNLDLIAALLLFCHFFPSTVYRYRNILQQAVMISSKTNKNNDLNRLQQQCLTLIRQSYFTL